jgi:DNA-binding winged helix-turn-helix (wHTH) protein/TolB-like protein
VYRFGVFVFDPGRLELTRDGRSVRLQPQPAQVLAELLARAGQLVTRDELQRAVWRDDTFVDFERGLNFCIGQIRAALNDEAGTPRYIRTVPKRGYEFICPVESSANEPAIGPPEQPADHRPRIGRRAVALGALAASAVGIVAYVAATAHSTRPLVAVARFDNETGNSELTRFADTVADAVVEQLTLASGGGYSVIGNAAVLRQPRRQRDLSAIASELHADYVILAQIQGDDASRRVLAHLIRLPDQTHVKVSRTDGVADATFGTADAIARAIVQAFGPQIGEPRQARR